MHVAWVFVTKFGDTAVTVPLAIATCCFLLVTRETRLAVGWFLCILGCAAAIGFLKLLFESCGHPLGHISLRSPSGHTAMSVSVYGSLALLFANRSPALLRNALYLGATLLVVGIGASRLALGYHTSAEVALGLVVGVAATASFRAILTKEGRPTLPVQWLAGAAIVLVGLLHGREWQPENTIRHLAGLLQLLAPWCS